MLNIWYFILDEKEDLKMINKTKSYKHFIAAGSVAALVATAVVPAVSANEVTTAAFTDVSARYELAINYLVTENLSSGLTGTSYGINQPIKRGDAAIILAQALNVMDPDAPASGFNDIPTRGVLAINSLKAAGIINGKTATSFGFNDTITRGEVALFMSDADAYNLEGDVSSMAFTDVNSRYAEAVAGLLASGITEGVSETQFGTDNSIKRGDFAIFVFRAEMLQIEAASDAFIEAMNGFAALGAEFGYEVVVDENEMYTFNITGSGDLPIPEEGTGFFETLAEQNIDTIEVNGEVYMIADESGNVSADAQAAKEAIIGSLMANETVDVTFHFPYDGGITPVTYNFNFFPE
jgi:hypothetical protein